MLGDFGADMLAGAKPQEEDRPPFTLSVSDISSNGNV